MEESDVTPVKIAAELTNHFTSECGWAPFTSENSVGLIRSVYGPNNILFTSAVRVIINPETQKPVFLTSESHYGISR